MVSKSCFHPILESQSIATQNDIICQLEKYTSIYVVEFDVKMSRK